MDTNVLGLIKCRKYINISVLQKELGCGFTKAGKILKELQDENLVSKEYFKTKGFLIIKERENRVKPKCNNCPKYGICNLYPIKCARS